MGSLQFSRDQFLAIVRAGVLAPSADNRHPLRFEQTHNSIRVWGDEAFAAAQFHRRVLFLISIGAVVENMVLRGGELGLQCAVSWFPDPGKPFLVSELKVTPANASADALSRAIPGRHTNRRFFRGPALADSQRKELRQDAEAVAGIRLIWLDQPRLRSKALRLIRIAEAERFRSKPLHHELFSSIRFEVGWKDSVEEGLAPGSLEVERPLRGAFGALQHWQLMRGLTFVGSHHLLALRAGDIPCRLSPHLVAIATSADLELGALAAGRAFERVWLRVASLGMGLQPFAACTLFALDGYKDVRAVIQRRLAKGWAELAPGVCPLILARFGWGPATSLRSGRRPTETYFLT